MTLPDVFRCPNCDFPSNYDDAMAVFKHNNSVCLMCEKEISPSQIIKVKDAIQYLKSRKIQT